jgi:hypothetical protein
MKEIKKSASIKSKVKGKETPFNVDLNYSEEYDSFNIKVKKGEGFMSYTDSLQGLPLEVVQKLNEMLEEVLIKAGSKTEMKENKMFDGGDFQSGVYAKGGGVKNNRVKVGVFSSEDLKSDVFLKAWEKKSKETGLTNIDLKTINKGGKTFIELYLIPNKSDSDVKIKDWYMKNYPTDDLGEELNDEVTFEDMWNEDYEKYNIYQVMGVGDSVIRERLFEHLAEIKGVSYDVVYKKMFLTGNYATGGQLIGNQKSIDLNKNDKIDAEDFEIMRSTMDAGWRKDRKYVNSTSRKDGKVIDYEVNYARKFNPSRKGYKGKTFADGGDVDRFSEYSNNALTDIIINLSRYENTESEIQMVKDILKKRKGENLVVEEEVTYFLNKDGIKVRSMVEPKVKLSEREWAEKYNPRAYEFMTERKMANGGSLPSGSINALGDLWFAVQQKDTDDYKMLSENLDKLNVPFSIQNEVSADAESQRGRKALNIPEVHDRIKKIVEKNNRKFATGGGVEKISFEDWLKKNNIEVYKRTYYWVADDGGNDYMYSGSKGEVMKSLREDWKKSFAYGGGVSKFEKLSDKVAKNYEGKRVKPQYQKEYGKVYSKSEAKEVGDKVAGKVKANQKMATGGETKKGGKGAIMILAKQIRKDGEKWTDAVKRAGQQLK